MPAAPVDAATITAAYAVGHRDVTLNGYGTSGLGVFTLRMDPGDPGSGDRLALCIEAHTSHSSRPGSYRLVDNQVHSPQLDYLLWRYGWPGTAMSVHLGHDHDTATALGALAWYYADASRRGGGQVWADPTSGAAATPVAPHPWSALPAGGRLGLRAGGQRLTGAERRVHELFLEAEARQGPWTMSAVRHAGTHASVTITGPSGPISEVDGVRFVVRDPSGRALVNQAVATDRRGVASVPMPALADGGSIEVSMFAPGVHQEWDGDGDIQRLATATTARLDRRLEVTALPRHLEVVKRSTDDGFSPAGAQFELLDGNRRIVGVATADADGRARFAPIDPSRHPAPYTVREAAAPAGLAPLDHEVTVPSALSSDPARPTLVEISNDPVAHRLVVRKRLDDDRVGPADRSGFGFEVTRADGRPFGTVVTGPDGRTPPLIVTQGRFMVCERSRPPWAAGLLDPGCVTTEITGVEHEVVYTNLVPTPRLSTRVSVGGSRDEARAGPAMLPASGGALTDVVRHEGLVPGTIYTLLGEILAHTDAGPQPTGITGRTTFVAGQPDGIVEVGFEVPSGVSGATPIEVGVVVQRLVVGDGSDGTPPVAEHVDPSDLDQTFWIPRIRTEAGLIGSRAHGGVDDGATETGPDGLIDVAHLTGLPPGRYRSEVVWHERLGPGDCRATTATAEAWFEPDADHRASVTVGPVAVWPDAAGRTFVAFHTVERLTDDAPVVVTAHADCEAAEQTITLPSPAAPVERPAPPAVPEIPDEDHRVEEEAPPVENVETPRAEAVAEPDGPSDPPEPTQAEELAVRNPTDVTPAPLDEQRTTPRALPAAGSGALAPGALALMLLGAGGLVLVSATYGRGRWS